METLNLPDTITAIAKLDKQAVAIKAALDVHAAAEPDHARRGPLLRVATVLADLHGGIRMALVRYQ